jgi:uncharacterized repeat protein (TIGR03803 family)
MTTKPACWNRGRRPTTNKRHRLWIARSASAILIFSLCLILASCGSSGKSSQSPPPPIAQFFLQAIPENPLMTPGNTYATSISAMPLVGSTFQGAISVSISGLPSGLTATPNSFSAGPGTYGWFPVTIAADSSLPIGIYPFTVTGTSGSMLYTLKMAVGLIQPPPQPAPLPQAQVIYSFTGQQDGGGPSGALISDSAGNLYGTAFEGGTYGTGVVFELSFSNGAWFEAVLHNFGNGTDGSGPLGDLVFDSSGNLYGVTRNGGSLGVNGYGIVYELTPTATGWQETVLHSFAGGADGENPGTGVVLDKDGNPYGTTEYGGAVGSKYCPTGCGLVFTLARTGSSWAYSVIHNFQYYPDGDDPGGSHMPGDGLIIDGQGNLYGTTYDGGSQNCPQPSPYSGGQGCGVVFKMTPSSGAWQYSVLHTFEDTHDGLSPSGLFLDPSGNLYLTSFGGFSTPQCGNGPCGNFFELTPTGTLTQLWYFWGDNLGWSPSGLVRDQAGNIYGVTGSGGPTSCEPGVACGTVFQLSQVGQSWVGSGFYDFSGGAAGWFPSSVTAIGGKIFGTAVNGGGSNYGVIFEITP